MFRDKKERQVKNVCKVKLGGKSIPVGSTELERGREQFPGQVAQPAPWQPSEAVHATAKASRLQW